MNFCDLVEIYVFSISSAAYLLAFAHSLLWFNFQLRRTEDIKKRRYVKISAATQLALFSSGACTFILAVDVPLNILSKLTHIPNIAILLCHLFSLAWDEAAILVVLHWIRPRGIDRSILITVSCPFLIGAVILLFLFALSDHSDIPLNLVAYLGPSLTGTCYLGIFLVSIAVSRAITLYVVLHEISNVKLNNLRVALILIGWESVIFFMFVSLRTTMHYLVIHGSNVVEIDWIPATIAGIANLILIAGYTYPDLPAYHQLYRSAIAQFDQYRILYALWRDLSESIKSSIKSDKSFHWRKLSSAINLRYRTSQRIADIDHYLTYRIGATQSKSDGILIDAVALPTALDDLSAYRSPRDELLLELARKYSSRRKNLGRPCLDELPAMIGALP